MGDELFHANRRTDGQTHMTKLIVAFLSFANALKKINLVFRTDTLCVY